jgi:hypothetical protein
MSDQLIDIGLYASYALVFIAIIAAVVGNVVNAVKNPKSLIKSGIGIVALGLIFFIGYSMSPSVIDPLGAKAFSAVDIDPELASTVNTYRLVGGAFTTTLVLVIVAVAGLVYSSVARILK